MIRALSLAVLLLPVAVASAQESGCPALYDEATRYRGGTQVEQARVAAEALLACPTASDRDRAQARYRLITARYQRADPARADSLYSAFLGEGQHRLLEPTQLALFHMDRAGAARLSHQWVKSISAYNDAIREGQHMPLTWRVQRYSIVSQLYLRLGHVDLAEASAQEALRIATEAGDYTEQARAATVRLNIDQYRATLRLLSDPAERERIVHETHYYEAILDAADARAATEAVIRFGLIDVRHNALVHLGRHDEALTAADRLAEIAAQTQRDDMRVAVRLNRARTLMAMGRQAEARALIPDLVEAARSQTWVASAIYSLEGEFALREMDYARAEHAFETVRTLDRAARLQLSGSAWASISHDTRFYGRSLALTHALRGNAEAAVQAFGSYLAQPFQDTRRIRATQSASEPDEAALRPLREELAESHRRFLQGEITVQQLNQAVIATSAMLIRASQDTEAPDFDVRRLQAQLRTDRRVVLGYQLSDDPEWPSHAFVVRADTLAVVPLEARLSDLARLAGQIAQPATGSGWLLAASEPLRALYRALIEPVEALLPEGAPLTIIPDGPLSDVPFGTLLWADAAPGRYAEWPYLLRRHAVSTDIAPPAARSAAPRLAAPVSRPLIAFGRTEFEVAAPDYAFLMRSSGAEALPHLPSVRDEIAAVRRSAPRGTFAVDEGATPERLLELISDARVVHLASHVSVSPQPLYSSVLLSPSDPEDPRSGDLYFFDLLDREVKADLVVLSGCDSAAGEARFGQSLLGLHYAFRVAGAASTLGTLWPVDDAAMAQLMALFYGELRRGVPSDEALRRAQLAFLESAEGIRSSPMVWGGLVLSGTPGPVELRERPPLPGAGGFRWMLAATLAFGLIGAFLSGRIRS